MKEENNIKIFSGSASTELAKKIAKNLGIPLSKSEIIHFADGETFAKSDTTVRGDKVFIIQSTSTPVNENIMELLVFIDSLKRASAKEIVAVVPYYGYARQDRKAHPREPITAKLVADLLTTAGATRVVTMDLHARQIQGFFNIPVDHMEALPIFAEYFLTAGFSPEDTVVVSPDIGGVKRARALATWLHSPLAIIDKRRPKPNVSEVMNLIGDVKGKKAIIIDDLIDTAGTICNAADALKKFGAKEVYVCATHPVFSGPAKERLQNSVAKKVIVSDSIELPEDKKFEKLEIVSCADILSETIERIYKDIAISGLFEIPKEIEVKLND
ncbi:ribose-phosphate diphosphokinase [Oceanivirga miroungae]|uniref:Ribose-phosphate pyrophosphokinase n=1 Tax=Oceanivirga miroungae TaxID=1130046 RepID=A0A6I8M6M8_9FUSO|nr:ribose-phosphate pyrophosphokinase [Oceanivirga miroungae]VWL85552.1 ribose-phosphate pyrophosphokinase [Oceanivirga miroungae]